MVLKEQLDPRYILFSLTYFQKQLGLVITKGYRVLSKKIEDHNAFAPLCAWRKVHAIESQNMRDQITSDRRSKCQ